MDSSDLLAGLDAIDWPTLSPSPYMGDAIAHELRAACGPDSYGREDAMSQLLQLLCGRCLRDPAVWTAVPFLVRLALAGQHNVRADALGILSDLAYGCERGSNVPTGINPDTRFDELIQGDDWSLCRDAVLKSATELSQLLQDPDPGIREKTVVLLCRLPEIGQSSTARLVTLLTTEHDRKVVATALEALSLLAPARSVELLTRYLGTEDWLVRWAAATALARIGTAGDNKTAVPPQFDDVLMDQLFAELVAFAATDHVTVFMDHHRDGRLYTDTARLLLRFADRQSVDTIVTAIADCLQNYYLPALDDLAGDAVMFAFQVAPESGSGPAFADLSPAQQRLITALADHHLAATVRQYPQQWLTQALALAQLPPPGNALRRYAGLPPLEVPPIRPPDRPTGPTL
ncbi:HEAT repeat domain-containing protein [Kribbella sp. NPDC056345]|uniref:HEAT repeat domain-containing protein n=1 Tax=Kribbella sp. NPDC056345 TaxID=3345789 RepID=UPI0035E2A607